jgi:hypothetical protein
MQTIRLSIPEHQALMEILACEIANLQDKIAAAEHRVYQEVLQKRVRFLETLGCTLSARAIEHLAG